MIDKEKLIREKLRSSELYKLTDTSLHVINQRIIYLNNGYIGEALLHIHIASLYGLTQQAIYNYVSIVIMNECDSIIDHKVLFGKVVNTFAGCHHKELARIITSKAITRLLDTEVRGKCISICGIKYTGENYNALKYLGDDLRHISRHLWYAACHLNVREIGLEDIREKAHQITIGSISSKVDEDIAYYVICLLPEMSHSYIRSLVSASNARGFKARIELVYYYHRKYNKLPRLRLLWGLTGYYIESPWFLDKYSRKDHLGYWYNTYNLLVDSPVGIRLMTTLMHSKDSVEHVVSYLKEYIRSQVYLSYTNSLDIIEYSTRIKYFHDHYQISPEDQRLLRDVFTKYSI